MFWKLFTGLCGTGTPNSSWKTMFGLHHKMETCVTSEPKNFGTRYVKKNFLFLFQKNTDKQQKTLLILFAKKIFSMKEVVAVICIDLKVPCDVPLQRVEMRHRFQTYYRVIFKWDNSSGQKYLYCLCKVCSVKQSIGVLLMRNMY